MQGAKHAAILVSVNVQHDGCEAPLNSGAMQRIQLAHPSASLSLQGQRMPPGCAKPWCPEVPDSFELVDDVFQDLVQGMASRHI